MINAVITGDLISSDLLNPRLKQNLYEQFNKFIDKLMASDKDLQGEVGRGDWFQLLVHQPEKSLYYALTLKCFLKSFALNASPDLIDTITNSPPRKIERSIIDARIAIGIGEISFVNKKIGISDGDAFKWSGRLLDTMKGHKQSLMIHIGNNDELQTNLDVIFVLLDTLLSKTTPSQCNVIKYKLNDKTEVEIAAQLKKSQSAINQHLNAAGWHAINETLTHYNNLIKKYTDASNN